VYEGLFYARPMRWRALLGMVVLGLLGFVAEPASVAGAGTGVRGQVASFVSTPASGVVYARAVGADGVEVRYSFVGLEPGRDHVVLAASRACSHLQPGADVWRLPITADEDGRAFGRELVHRLEPLPSARSIRVFALDPQERVACTPGLAGQVRSPTTGGAAPNVSVATWIRGPFHGIAYARAFGDAFVELRFSLLGLEPSRTYLLAGSTRPCRRPARDTQSVWVVDVDTDANGDRAFRRRLTERFGSFADIRSTRLYLLEDPGQFGTQVSCTPGVVGRLTVP
jgi:hypothetical protein